MQTSRVVFLDYIRVIACFGVIVIHACGLFINYPWSGAIMFANDSNRFWVSFYDAALFRTAVPLFFIISACLLVPMKSGISMYKFLKRRFLRIIPPFFCFQVVYSIIPNVGGHMVDIQSMVLEISKLPFNFSPHAYHLWFIYPLISIYLFIPIISPWLEKATNKEELFIVFLFFISTFIPFIHRYLTPNVWGECSWNCFHVLWYNSGYLGYVILAHYLRCHIKWSRGRRLWIGLICFVIGSLLTGLAVWKVGNVDIPVDKYKMETFMGYCSPNVFCATLGAFLLFSCIKGKKQLNWITELSKLSFGIYLVHILFLQYIAKLFLNHDNSFTLPVCFAIPVIALLTYICCAITCKLLSYVPGSKWIVGV